MKKVAHIPHVKDIEYESNGDTEAVHALVFRSLDHPNSWEAFEFKSNKLGHLLIGLLNLDLSDISNRLSKYNIENNFEKAYQEMLILSDVFGVYMSEEFDTLHEDFCSLNKITALTIRRVREYIDFCEQKQIDYNTKFFEYLLFNRYFEACPDICQLRGVDRICVPFDLDEVESKSAGDLSKWYNTFIENTGSEFINTAIYSIETFNRLGGILLVSLCEIARHGRVIRKCRNCGRYFIPGHRSDTIYCDNICPQESSMTCKEYGSQRLWYERQKEDELATLSRNVLSAKSMLAKRNPDISEYAISYDYFRNERKKWKKAVDEGSKTKEEYREWLLLMQSQKRIKEAVNGND